MAELADALDLGSSGNTRAGSTPVIRTTYFFIGAWLSLVERCVRDAEVAGSNPVAPIFLFSLT